MWSGLVRSVGRGTLDRRHDPTRPDRGGSATTTRPRFHPTPSPLQLLLTRSGEGKCHVISHNPASTHARCLIPTRSSVRCRTAPNMTAFDVYAYLKQLGITPSLVEPLTGGAVNETFRVLIDRASSPPSCCRGQYTVILKYAPPFIARMGPEAPFDVRRQHIEASSPLLTRIDRREPDRGLLPPTDSVRQPHSGSSHRPVIASPCCKP